VVPGFVSVSRVAGVVNHPVNQDFMLVVPSVTVLIGYDKSCRREPLNVLEEMIECDTEFGHAPVLQMRNILRRIM
jgi:hypothetical protein